MRRSPSPFFQRTPTTTQSAVFSGLTFTTALRSPARYGSSRRLAITPSRPIASNAESHSSAASRSRVAGERTNRANRPRGSSAARRAARTSAPARPRRARRMPRRSTGSPPPASARGSRPGGGESASRRSRGRRRGRSRSRRRGKTAAEAAPRAAGAREVAKQRPRVSRPEPELARGVLEEAAEAVPLGLTPPLGKVSHELGLHRRERDGGVQVRGALDGLAAPACARHAPNRSPVRHHAVSLLAPSSLSNSMRRVAITGLGAVTPIGLDAPSTWDAAVSGRSGVGWIEAFDASEYPVRIAAEVRGFEVGELVPPKEARRMDRNVLLAVAAAQEAWDDAGLDEVDAARVGILVGSAIGGIATIVEQQQVFADAAPIASRPSSSPRCSSTRRAARSRSNSASRERTSLRSRPAPRGRRRSARLRSRSAAARRTSCSRAAPRRRSCR